MNGPGSVSLESDTQPQAATAQTSIRIRPLLITLSPQTCTFRDADSVLQ